MRMSKESKRGKEVKERKLKTFQNEKFSIVSLSLLYRNTHALPHAFTAFVLFWRQDIGNFMFHCLQNDDVIEFALFCQIFF